jgi:NDP-sugar pyrophosphorylase family protein
VLSVDGHRAVRVEEKPSQNFLCNAGIYVLTPDVVRLVAADMRLDMTDVIAKALERDMTVSVFPIHEFWSDIGSPRDLEQALAEFAEVSRT